MFASVFGFELNRTVFFIIILVAFIATFVIHYMNQKKSNKNTEPIEE